MRTIVNISECLIKVLDKVVYGLNKDKLKGSTFPKNHRSFGRRLDSKSYMDSHLF